MPNAVELYYVEQHIPEIEAQPGDMLVDDPMHGLTILRPTGARRSVLALRSTSLRKLTLPKPPIPLSLGAPYQSPQN